ncbi:MAG: hypothetical protein KatS3mg026_1005 [Bacteroidia bacterium]|nr:MAG: hypothetical protein KatS3mg026_1005 [Bacteroidia bacterium]
MAGVIQKIRDKAGLAVLLIGISLLIFILTDLLQSNPFVQGLFSGQSDLVARIGSEEIRYAEYNALYERALRNTSVEDPLAEEQIKNAVWQQLLTDKLYTIEAEAAGLAVSDQELYEMFVSDQPHPLVMQVFSQGGQVYDKARVQQVLAQAENNPEIAAQLREFEDYLVQARLREKYEALLRATAYVPAPLAAYQNTLDNTTLSFSYLAISYSAVADSLVPVSESDIRRYYEDHKAEYALREPERILQYVALFKEPSREDSQAVYQKLLELREAFEKAEDDSLFAAANTDIRQDFTWRRWPDLPREVQDSLREIGQVIGPYLSDRGYVLAKVDSIARDSQPVYRLRHIMIAKGLDSVAARRRADSLLRVLKPEKFAEAANQFSDDWQTRFSSGELGWYTASGRFGKAFYEALAKAPVGRIYGLIASDQGYHIVEVQEKSDRLVRLAFIEKEIAPSNATLSVLRQKIQQVARAAEKNFEDAVQQAGLNLRISPSLRPSSASIPALVGTRELIQWAFSHKAGEMSGVIETQNAFVVARIVSAAEPPYRKWEDIRDQLEPKARNSKKAEYVLKRLKEKGGATLGGAQGSLWDGSLHESRRKCVVWGYRGAGPGHGAQGVGGRCKPEGKSAQRARGGSQWGVCAAAYK